MFGLFKKDTESSISYIFDISSASVAGAIVKFQKGELPKIIYTKKIDLELPTSVDSSRLLSDTVIALKTLALDIQKEGYSHLTFTPDKSLPVNFHCFLASPWAIFETKVLKLDKSNTVFTKSVQEDLIKKEEELFLKNIVSKYQTISGKDEVLVDKKIINIKLNGYTTTKPYGKTADSVELAVYLGVSSQDILSKFEQTISGVIKTNKDFIFHTFGIASYSVMNDFFEEDEFSIIDITGEITDVSIIRGDIVVESISFPLAKNQLVREVARKFATSYFEAESVLRMYMDKSISKQLESKVRSTIDNYGVDFVETLKQVCPDTFSGKIGLLSPLHYGDLVCDWLKTVTTQKVVQIDKKLLSNKIKSTKEVDPFLAIESLYLSKII